MPGAYGCVSMGDLSQVAACENIMLKCSPGSPAASPHLSACLIFHDVGPQVSYRGPVRSKMVRTVIYVCGCRWWGGFLGKQALPRLTLPCFLCLRETLALYASTGLR